MIKKILVSQPRPATERNPYSEMEHRFGVEFDFYQLIHLEGLDVHEFRLQRINPLDYTAVLLTSRLAVDHYFRMCEEMRLQVPESMHYYCISEAVANYLQKYIQYRKRRVFFSENNRFEDLLPTMNRRPNEKYLMVSSDVHNNDSVINMLAENGITVKPAVMYRTVASQWPQDKAFDYDMLVLFTPTGVASVKKNFPEWNQGETLIACFGQNTTVAAEEENWRIDIKAPTPDCPSITTAIERYLEQHIS
jgi:uroporphyrinogen-III synthase